MKLLPLAKLDWISRRVLLKQIELSKRLNLPLNVHSRSAGKPVITFLIENGCEKVQLHAFSGNAKNAKAGIDAGFYFSIPPSFSNAEGKKQLIEAIPMDQLLLETDSPVLGPDKQARNEPANIKISAEFIANVKNISVEDVVKKTTENAYRLYQTL
uniref:Uncharacterized protein n=1 Tax=Panagrolaimus sp. JU765 TaxID=591449 RepID=A0AC34R9V0_9BILA